MSNTAELQELQKAVALYYDGKNSPVISAKGTGDLAAQIIELAQEYDVPLCDNPSLVDFLVTLELGDEIPEKLYLAVAYIIAFAYELKGEAPQS
ncbi:EscU/YscU/HrcU family type III secretion system export apparatus switch protein [Gilvimarinus sp. DA14]|uniref:EscU/YscU/HrcU family type III secretion system export apparatus switch protein n=1 Tax=Gilvimarinus sp. DA14 TaxID=2956798 RepID=UPI0020B799D8|nr:EscU/YscU/HrcU family type III secretion system export apparatus switch protein [Gilvimarinus sp. DA14]UTF60700.1 EscU/YscU/HrcU family type III secretion system export apparatus switch protein [Gilvimarinus sp. DA14]